MKKTFLFMLFCCLLTVTTTSEALTNKGGEANKIDLYSKLAGGKQRSLIKPIQAFIEYQSIEVDFNATLGTIVISVYDETGSAVYLQSVITYAGQQIFIDVSSFEDGEYSIVFTDSQGGYMSGDFVI